MYVKAGIDHPDNDPNHNIRILVKKLAITGVYDEELGYHFNELDLRTTLYNFKPADADFKITLNKDDQNDKVKEKWGTNFQWNADNYTLTLSPVWALYNFNFNDKKVSDMTEANNGVKLSWTFNAGKGETTSNGNEQWYIKDPVRQPGENKI